MANTTLQAGRVTRRASPLTITKMPSTPTKNSKSNPEKSNVCERKSIDNTKRFSELCDRWLKVKASKRSAHHDKSVIETHLRPFFNDILIKDISDDHQYRYLSEKPSLAKKTIFNHLTLLIAMLNLAKNSRWLAEVPKITKPKIKLVGADFNYLKITEDVQKFLAAASMKGENFYGFYLTAIMAGMRAGEIAGLKWADINFEQ